LGPKGNSNLKCGEQVTTYFYHKMINYIFIENVWQYVFGEHNNFDSRGVYAYGH
jgi:hypothetical protein